MHRTLFCNLWFKCRLYNRLIALLLHRYQGYNSGCSVSLIDQFPKTTATFVKATAVLYFLLRSTSLPPLECPLPSQCGQCELKIEIQPKPHHRAHYETEGSRGAIKSDCGRHPVVKVRFYTSSHISL